MQQAIAEILVKEHSLQDICEREVVFHSMTN